MQLLGALKIRDVLSISSIESMLSACLYGQLMCADLNLTKENEKGENLMNLSVI